MPELNIDRLRLNAQGKYEYFTQREARIRMKAIEDEWEIFLRYQNLSLEKGDDYFVHDRNLYEVISRVDKREAYYHIFHDGMAVCEYKFIALMCFWLINLKPFMVVKSDINIYNFPNELFAYFLILSTFRKIFEQEHPTEKFKEPSEKQVQDIIYTFKYCDITREGMIFFVETLARSYNIANDEIKRSSSNTE